MGRLGVPLLHGHGCICRGGVTSLPCVAWEFLHNRSTKFDFWRWHLVQQPPLPTTLFADLFMMSAFLVCGFMALQRLRRARVDGAAGMSAKPSELPKT